LHQAAAGRAALIAVIVAVLAGGVILAPSLGLLLRLMLTGGFDPGSRPARQSPGSATSAPSDAHTGASARLAVACLFAGFVLLTVVEAGIAHVFGVLALLAAAVLAFGAVAPADLSDSDTRPVGS
jgi:cytochrome d ubiquinol oxidase subunit II